MQIAWKTTTRRATSHERRGRGDLNPLFPGPVFQVQYHPEYPADTTPLNICSHCRWLSFQAKINLPTEKREKDVHEDYPLVSDNQSSNQSVPNKRITVPPFDSVFNDRHGFLSSLRDRFPVTDD